MRTLTPFLVLSALADGTLVQQLFTGFLKALAAAGFPATAEQLGGLLAVAIMSFWAKRRSKRELDRKVDEKLAQKLPDAVAQHVGALVAGPPKVGTRKRKKINV